MGQDPSTGRILQSTKSLNETTKKQGPKPGFQSLAAAQDSRVIISITRRILGLPLFLQLTSYRDLWPLQVLDRVRDPAPEAASTNSLSAVMHDCKKIHTIL